MVASGSDERGVAVLSVGGTAIMLGTGQVASAFGIRSRGVSPFDPPCRIFTLAPLLHRGNCLSWSLHRGTVRETPTWHKCQSQSNQEEPRCAASSWRS